MDVSANQHHHYNQKHLDLLPQVWQEKFWPVWFWSYKCSRKRPDVSSKNILHCRHKHSWTCSLSPLKPFHCHKHGFKSLIILLNIPGFGRQHVRMSPDGSSQTRSSFTSWSLEPGLEQRSLARHLLTWISDHRHWCEREMRHLHEYQSCTCELNRIRTSSEGCLQWAGHDTKTIQVGSQLHRWERQMCF